MSSFSTAILEKVAQDRRRGDFDKAIKRLEEGLSKSPSDIDLHKEAIEVSLEAGEALKSVDFFKRALRKLPNFADDLWDFAKDKVRSFNDAALCSFLVDQAVKKRDLARAEAVLECLKDHTAADLLKRIRTKKQTLSSAMNGGLALKGELVANGIAEALICLRAKRYGEAVKVFLRVLEEKPVENEVLVPYLIDLEKRIGNKGNVAYAAGSGYLLAENYKSGLPKIIQAVAESPQLAEDAIGRVEQLRNNPHFPEDEVAITIAQLYIFKGDYHHASECFTSLLGKNAGLAALVVDVLEGHLKEIGDHLVLHYLLIEAAFLANRNEKALTHLKAVYTVKKHRQDLMAWLDVKSQERFLPVEVLSFYAENALQQGLFDKAVEIFREVIAQAPHERAYIKEILAAYRSNAAAERLYLELSGPEEQAKVSSGLEIEHYGRADFTLDRQAPAPASGQTQPPPPAAAQPPAPKAPVEPSAFEFSREEPKVFKQAPSPRDPADGPATGLEIETERSSILGIAPGAAPAQRPRLFSDPPPESQPQTPTPNTRRAPEPTARHEQMQPAESAVPPTQPSPASSTVEAAPQATAPPATPIETQSPPEPIDRAVPVPREPAPGAGTPVANAPAETGPAVPPEVTAPPAAAEPVAAHEPATEDAPNVILLGLSDIPDEVESQHAPEVTEPGEISPAARDAAIPAATAAPDAASAAPAKPAAPPAPGFETLYAQFRSGRLNRTQVLDLCGQALEEERLDELKSLLEFKPDTLGEEIKRKIYLGEYYLAKDEPLSALVIFKTISINALGKDERLFLLMRTAYAYQCMSQFEAAHSTYLRIMSEEPNFEVAEHMAKLNYRRYLDEMAGGAPVLEKVTKL